MKLVNILGANIPEFVTVVGKGIEIHPDTVISGELSQDNDGYKIYAKQAFTGDEQCVAPSVFIGSILPNSFKTITEKSVAFTLKVYCKGAGEYNSILVNCIASASQSNYITSWALPNSSKKPIVSIAGKLQLVVEDYNGKKYEKIKMLVNQLNVEHFGTPDKMDNSQSAPTKAKASKGVAPAAQSDEIPF